MSVTPPTSITGDIASADRIGRIGAFYVRSVIAQAGIRNEETSPGEDYAAVDLTVHLTSAAVTVQVKTGTAQHRRKDGTYSVPVKAEWCAKSEVVKVGWASTS